MKCKTCGESIPEGINRTDFRQQKALMRGIKVSARYVAFINKCVESKDWPALETLTAQLDWQMTKFGVRELKL